MFVCIDVCVFFLYVLVIHHPLATDDVVLRSLSDLANTDDKISTMLTDN